MQLSDPMHEKDGTSGHFVASKGRNGWTLLSTGIYSPLKCLRAASREPNVVLIYYKTARHFAETSTVTMFRIEAGDERGHDVSNQIHNLNLNAIVVYGCLEMLQLL